MRVMTACLVALVLVGTAQGEEFYVSLEGSARGDGSAAAPWDLQTALRHPAAVKAGDTLWLQGGTYRGRYECALAGTPDQPITVRAAAGARVKIDCVDVGGETQVPNFEVLGAAHDLVFQGFEITSSDPKRATKIQGPWPEDIRRGGVNCRGTRIKFINLIVHDTSQGFSWWAEGEGGEVYGCLIYYNGWQGPERGHGHAIYTQNKTGTKRIADNIIFGQFSHGIHAYGSGKAFLNGYDIEGNACFNNGALARDGARAPDVLVGGGCPAERIRVVDNVLYRDGVGTALRLGYGATNKDVVVRGNLVAGFTDLKDWQSAEVKGNTFIGPGTLLQLSLPKGVEPNAYAWDENTYVRTKVQWSTFGVIRDGVSKGWGWSEWQAAGLDGHGKYSEGVASGVHVVVRPNLYEAGRGHVIVLNYAKRDRVEVDLSKVLKPGDGYEVRAAWDYFGAPVTAGIYKGERVEIPMQAAPAVAPVGEVPGKLVVTAEFGAFVVRRK